MKLKKVLSLLLAVAMVLGTITIPAFAEESTPTDNVVAEISGMPYTSLQAAIEGANFGDTITVTGNIKDEAVIVNKSVTITSNAADADSKPTLNNVSIKADGAEVELIVSNLKFTGTSYINANNAKALTVDKVDANVTLNKADSVTNSRAAFISLGASELTTPLKLTVTNNNIVVTGDNYPDPILGWRYIADGSVISGNTFGSKGNPSWDAAKLMNMMDGATITLKDNTVYAQGIGFSFGQNRSRANNYTAVIENNTFLNDVENNRYMAAVWVEVSGADTTHATVKATSDNTYESRAFKATDICTNVTTWTSYAGIDVETDANGNVTSGTLTESSNTNVIAVGATVTIGETSYIKNSEGNLIKAVPAADLTYAGYVGTSGEGDTYRENIQVDLYDVYATQSLVVELWSGNTKLSTTSLREADRDDETAKLFPVIGTITANIVVKGKLSGSWDTEWHIAPSAAYLPDTIKVYADGVSEPVATWNGGFSDADEEKYLALGGVADGTEENPYIIDSLEALKAFRDKVDEQKADGSSQFAGKYVKLTTNIDLEGENWEPIGSMTGDHGSFTGVFDGDGHTISNLNVQGAGNGQGFFARTSGNAEIKNLKFNNVTVKSTDNSNYVGGVVGNAYANTKITNVHVTGTIDIAGRGYIGGIAGHGYVVMDNVSVVGEGTISSTFWCAGGILGYGGEGTTNITNSTVEGTGNGLVIKSAAGGLGSIVGMAEDNNGTQPISGSNLSAKNVKIQTYVGDFGTNYAEYALGYLYGGNPSQLTGNLTVDDVTFDAQGNTSPSVADIVASVDGLCYQSLEDALEAAEGGETITLLDDITTASTVTIDKNVIIDLSGKTLTGNVYINEGATVEIKNGTIICKDGRYDTINSFGTLTLTDVNADGERHIVRAKKGSLTINGGTYKYTGSATGTRNTINIGDYDNGTIVSSANVIINSGTFIGPKGTSADSGAAVSVQAGSTVTINGGKFTNGKNNTLGAQDGATLTVKGGLFDQNPAAYVAGDSRTFKDNGTSYWVVLAASSHSIAMSVDRADATYYDGDTITVSVAVNGGDYAISDWVLDYDETKVTYTGTVQLEKDSKTPVVDATAGTITEENYSTSSWGNLFADDSVVTYTFTVNTPIADTTALFAITNATVTTAAATPFGKTPVGDERVEVSIKLRDFGEVTTLDNGTAFTDAPHNIAFDNTAHEITVDVADVDGESVEYTYTKDGKEVNEIKAAGTYEVAYEITKPGYNPSTGTITVVIGNPEYVLETSIYTIGDHTLVMLYTNTDGMYPVYNDDAMLDISASGYKYQETAESTPVEYYYVYGIVIPSTTKTIDELKAAITFNTTKPFAIDPYDEDVNFVSPIDSSDIVFTLNVYGDYADVHDKYELLSRILKADVDRDGTNAKKVDVFDVTAIERAIYGK